MSTQNIIALRELPFKEFPESLAFSLRPKFFLLEIDRGLDNTVKGVCQEIHRDS